MRVRKRRLAFMRTLNGAGQRSADDGAAMRISDTTLTPTFGRGVQLADRSALHEPELRQRLPEIFSCDKLISMSTPGLAPEEQVEILSLIGPVVVENPDGALWSLVSNLQTAVVQNVAALPFHSDYQYMPQGPLDVVSLYAELTEQGEPTTFVNMVAALDFLPPSLRARAERLRVVQMADFSRTAPADGRFRMSRRDPRAPDAQYPATVQPMITTHPRTGERYLNISQRMTSHVEGWSEQASDELFAEIDAHVYVPANSYTHEWAVGDLIIWDNRALQHGRKALAQAARRTLRRVVVNSVDVPTMMRNVRPDPVKFPGIQWWKQDDAITDA